MFNRYWRSYPWFLQLIQLIIMLALLFSFFVLGLGSFLIPKLTGYNLTDTAGVTPNSPYLLRQAVLLFQFLYSFGTFLVPPLLFAYATHPRPAEYLGFRRPGKKIHWLLVSVLMLALIPVLIQIETWIALLPWDKATKDGAEQMEQVTNAITAMHSPVDFIKIFFLLALLPAFGEELLFRGVFMRFAAKRSHLMVFPIVISALMFAFAHSNVLGFLSIFLAGALLGLTYYWTGSIWLSILGHCINNGFQIVMLYIASSNKAVEKIFADNHIPAPLFLAGLVLSAGSLYLLWKNRTPLPADWAADYSPEELREAEQ